eukprot:2162013-Pyramimonas_sp.AAC.1
MVIARVRLALAPRARATCVVRSILMLERAAAHLHIFRESNKSKQKNGWGKVPHLVASGNCGGRLGEGDVVHTCTHKLSMHSSGKYESLYETPSRVTVIEAIVSAYQDDQ